ncbi:MAG: hypothetical protein ACI4VG_03525 [Lachnospiraceae bacterium]
MKIKRMRTCVGGNKKMVKKVFNKQNSLLVPVYDFTKTAVVDDVLSDGVNYENLYAEYTIFRYSHHAIYETDSVDNDLYEYKGFEMEYELTGSERDCELSIGGKILTPDGTTQTGKIVGNLEKSSIKLLTDEGPINDGYFSATFLKITYRIDTSHTTAPTLKIKKLIFIK